MALTGRDLRQRAFGQDHRLTAVDRLGIWLSARRVRRSAGSFQGKRVADIGCGYHASLAASLLPAVERLVLLDIALAPALKNDPRVTAIEGVLPAGLGTIPNASLDILICNSVLEHLQDPHQTLREFWRVLDAGGMALINVPSWRGKWFLEFSAFRLGLSPADEMDDHRMYYDPRDLWPLLVASGFRPHNIRCFTHKFGLNTFAECKQDGASAPSARP
jgi:SAM-dependent methyltransferase